MGDCFRLIRQIEFMAGISKPASIGPIFGGVQNFAG